MKISISDWWANRSKSPQQLLDEEAQTQLIELDRDILSRELEMIEGHFKVEGQKAKKAFLAQWMTRVTPSSVVLTHEELRNMLKDPA